MTVQTIATGFSHTIDTASYMDALPAPVKAALSRSVSAFASIMPEVLADHESVKGGIVGLSVVKLDKGGVVVQNANGTRFKIVCAESNRFNVAPSFTKGYGRTNNGVNVKNYLAERCDYVILANVKNRGKVEAVKIAAQDIESNTIVVKG